MSKRIWTEERRSRQSQVALESQLWLHSRGIPVSKKTKTRYNARRHGYFSQENREFRKQRRSKEVRKIERQCRVLIRSVKEKDAFIDTAEQEQHLVTMFNRFGENHLSKKLTNHTIIEVTYLIRLTRSTISFLLQTSLRKLYEEIEKLLNEPQRSD